MKEYIKADDHHQALAKQRQHHGSELNKLAAKHRLDCRAAETKGYARGIEHAWADAFAMFRRMIGQERSELLREWREAAVARANRREQKKGKT